MKKSHIFGAATLTLAGSASQVFAQAITFEGFSIGLNANVHATAFDQIAATATSTASATDQNLGVFALYTLALSDRYVLGVGASYDLTSYKVGSIGATDYTINEQSSFDITPGYAVSDKVLVYGKISAVNAKSASSTGTTTVDNSGTGYGIGARVKIAKSVFAQAEFTRHNFPEKANSVVTYSPLRQDQFSIGIAYRF